MILRATFGSTPITRAWMDLPMRLSSSARRSARPGARVMNQTHTPPTSEEISPMPAKNRLTNQFCAKVLILALAGSCGA
ncbi:hypothetical protein D3C80_1807780 [compost metagenome]